MLDTKLAARALGDIAGKGTKSAPVSAEDVIKAVARGFQLNPEDLKGPKRDRQTALARQLAMYLLKEATGNTLSQIGLEFGNRDHSTVSHATQKIAADIDHDPYLRRKAREIQQELYPGR
jgi:chromosomal replication initiator protein